MSDETQSPSSPCREFEMLIMRRLDGEISGEENARLEAHLSACAKCRKALSDYSRITAVTSEVEMKKVSEEEWDLYWCRVYNRLERGVAWILVCVGAAAVLAYALFKLVTELISDPGMAAWAKAGILVLVAGLALLFVSVLREQLTIRCTDRYRGVKR